jgi:hypothetical protein
MESCSNQKSAKQIKIYFIFEILQSSHPLPFVTALHTGTVYQIGADKRAYNMPLKAIFTK